MTVTLPERSSYVRRRSMEICDSKENLEKDSPYVLLVIPGDEGLHSMSPQVVVELVHVQ